MENNFFVLDIYLWVSKLYGGEIKLLRCYEKYLIKYFCSSQKSWNESYFWFTSNLSMIQEIQAKITCAIYRLFMIT